MTDFGLSAQQIAVICALSSGATATAAAEQAGVHRNTVSNWRRNDLAFQHAFAHAQYDRALYFREKAEELIDLAIKSIREILADPKTPPSVRLRAALAIVELASAPPEPEKKVLIDFEKIVDKRTPAQTVTEEQLAPAPLETASPEKLHNTAQPRPPATTSPAVHNPAQARTIKIGRNEPCPYGSGCTTGDRFLSSVVGVDQAVCP